MRLRCWETAIAAAIAIFLILDDFEWSELKLFDWDYAQPKLEESISMDIRYDLLILRRML
jgi:hypothetical protein